MTAKRFTMKWNDFLECNDWFDNGNYLKDSDVTGMLNALHEENQSLKSFIQELTSHDGRIYLMNGIAYNVKKILGELD